MTRLTRSLCRLDGRAQYLPGTSPGAAASAADLSDKRTAQSTRCSYTTKEVSCPTVSYRDRAAPLNA